MLITQIIPKVYNKFLFKTVKIILLFSVFIALSCNKKINIIFFIEKIYINNEFLHNLWYMF